jgi:hypothetical protein
LYRVDTLITNIYFGNGQNTMQMKTATFTLLATLFATTAAFSGSTGREAASKPATPGTMSRTAFVAGVTGTLLAPSIAFAKTAEKACECEKKQNKDACMDLCLYECTKHGGSKAECSKDCARQCKSERGQRTMATPITEKGVDYK